MQQGVGRAESLHTPFGVCASPAGALQSVVSQSGQETRPLRARGDSRAEPMRPPPLTPARRTQFRSRPGPMPQAAQATPLQLSGALGHQGRCKIGLRPALRRGGAHPGARAPCRHSPRHLVRGHGKSSSQARRAERRLGWQMRQPNRGRARPRGSRGGGAGRCAAPRTVYFWHSCSPACQASGRRRDSKMLLHVGSGILGRSG